MQQPGEKDFAVEVEQGNTKKVWTIKAPSKDQAVNQANRILKIQNVRPFKVIRATEIKA
jgi:hypothetical protein